MTKLNNLLQKNMKQIKFAFPFVIAIICIIIGFIIAKQTNSNTTLASQNTQAPTIQTVATVNKNFTFPVIDSYGQTITNISYTITNVDKQNQVIIKGQRASAIAGKIFLVIAIKLTNASSQTIQLNSRDYIRMSVNNSKELFAPDMHSDPVIVQPISTEYTQLGFPIDSTAKKIVLHVGQLSGSKTDIPINFK